MKKKFFPILCVSFLFAGLMSGCLSGLVKNQEDISITLTKEEYQKIIDDLVSKENKLDEVKKTAKQKDEAYVKEIDHLKNTIESLEEQIDYMKAERTGEKIVVLFDGKVRYTIEAKAVMDYEETLALTMNNDLTFKETINKGGNEADLALLVFLKKMSIDDRRVTLQEVKRYAKTAAQPKKIEAASVVDEKQNH